MRPVEDNPRPAGPRPTPATERAAPAGRRSAPPAHRAVPVILAALLVPTACGAQSPDDAGDPLPACEWCGTAEAPDSIGPSVTIAGEDEPGQRIGIFGVVYRADGRTPAPDVLLYLYQTNADGIYETLGDETGNGRRHGHLRGWLRTDEAGRYEIRTIRPGNYPDSDEEQHIHVTVQEPDGTPEYWLPSFKFVGDPYLDADPDAPNVLELRRGDDGEWMARRDIVLPDEPPQ